MPINFPSNPENNQTYTSGDTTWIYDGTAWKVVTSTTTINLNAFSNIAVSGQNNVVADSTTDTLTLVAGSNMTITTNAASDTITFASTGGVGGGENTFSNIAVTGQSTIAADSTTDTLTVAAGSGISITTDATNDILTIASTVTPGVANFSGLTDASNASLTVDHFYLPAITKLTVTNSGASAYLFDQYTGGNPQLYAISGTTIAFELNASGHPFLIQNSIGNNYDTGLVHVSTGGVVSVGANAQGKDSGTLYWKIPSSVSGTYRYQCSIHPAMVGSINVKSFATL